MKNTTNSSPGKPGYGAIPVWFIWGALAFLLICRLYFHLFASPIPDEAYYWLWGQHPDWSYFDHPPLQAWMQGVFTAVFGASRAALRAPGLLSSAVVIWTLLWWLKKSRAWGVTIDPRLAVLIYFASPLFFIFTMMVFHDHLLIALLSVASITAFTVLDKTATSGKVPVAPLYTTAILLGLAGLTKYSAVLFAVGIFAVAVSLPRFRAALKTPHLYLAVLVGVLCVLPVAYWNAGHSAASFQFHLSDRLNDARTFAGMGQNFVGFLLATTIALSPFLIAPLIGFLRGKSTPTALKNWRALGMAILLVSGTGCLILSYYTSVLYYWGLVAFIAFLPFAAFYFRRRWQVIAHVIYGLVFAGAFTFNYAIAPINAVFGGYDSEFAILYGWPEISAKTLAAQETQQADFLATSDYRSGAILAFWTTDTSVEVLSRRISQFDFWMDGDLRRGQNAIILTDKSFPMTAYIRGQFQQVELLEEFDIRKFGFFVNSYQLYAATGFTPVAK